MQKLTLGDLRDLYTKHTCVEFRAEVLKYLNFYDITAKDDTPVEISETDRVRAARECTEDQKNSLRKLGIELEGTNPVKNLESAQISKFSNIIFGDSLGLFVATHSAREIGRSDLENRAFILSGKYKIITHALKGSTSTLIEFQTN